MSIKHILLSSRGFSYIGLLILIALISLAASYSVQLGAIAQRRQAEDELLFIGQQYKRAIRSYFESTPPGSYSTGPARLEDLLKDSRFPQTKRHLRQLYADPLTGKNDWLLIQTLDGKGIIGIKSRSAEKPIRISNFPDELFYFKEKKSYADWPFVYGVVCNDLGCEILPSQIKEQ